MATEGIIKTTARYQDAQEPSKQRPIIHIAPAPLPNTIRASLDGGRDNPFKPEGPIYRSADPIVDFYKHGPNQSRGQSPTDSQLLLQGATGTEQLDGSSCKSQDQARSGELKKKNCCRRWLCCCCCCGSSPGSSGNCKWMSCGSGEANKDTVSSYAVVDANKANKMAQIDRTFEPFETGANKSTKKPDLQQVRSTKGVVLVSQKEKESSPEEARREETANQQEEEPATKSKSRCLIS